MNILQAVGTQLRQAGYTVYLGEDTLIFENEVLYGLAKSYEAVELLLESWESDQEQFLDFHSRRIQHVGAKGWNAYSIFLTPEEAEGPDERGVLAIEEDLRATRKIARCGIKTKTDVTHALHPVLPLQQSTVLSDEDVLERLRRETGIDRKLLSSLQATDDVEKHLTVLQEM